MQSGDTGGDERASGEPREAVRVAFVEDDGEFREVLADELSDDGFLVRCFADAESLLAALTPALEAPLEAPLEADVILLDWGLPGRSGIELMAELRRRHVDLPIVFLTGRSLTATETEAFESGAVDFIDKLRGTDVLVRRLRRAASMARHGAADTLPPEPILVCGRLVLKAAIKRAYWNDIDLGLTVSEFNIVHLLASNVGRPMSYRAIYDQMHYEGFVAGHGEDGFRMNVRSAIKRIRKKFLKLDPTFAEIENCAAVGYAWGRPPDAAA